MQYMNFNPGLIFPCGYLVALTLLLTLLIDKYFYLPLYCFCTCKWLIGDLFANSMLYIKPSVSMIMTQSSLILDTSSASCLFFVKGVLITVCDINFHINLKINLLIPVEHFVMTSVAITWTLNINLGKLTLLLFWVLLSVKIVCLICFFRPLVPSPCLFLFLIWQGIMVMWMINAFHCLGNLKSWSSVGGIDWVALGCLALLKEV